MAVRYTAQQVQDLFDHLAGAIGPDMAKKIATDIDNWQADLKKDEVKEARLPFLAKSLRQGCENWFGE